MVDKKKYVYSLNQETGKLSKGRSFEGGVAIGKINEDFDVVVRPTECPYGIENAEVLQELTKPLRTAKISCNLEIELSLSARFNKHTHAIVTDIDRSKFPSGTDFSEWEFDPGTFVCGLFFEIAPKVTASVPKVELQEDKETLKRIKRASIQADKTSQDLCEVNESDKRLKNYSELLSQTTVHLQKYLKGELERISERLAFEIHTLGERGDEREAHLKIFLEKEESALRKRLPAPKGRIANRERSDFESVKTDFLDRSIEILGELERNGNRQNKSQLAKKMFRSDNPLLLLNRKLKEFHLTFEEIMGKYTEQKLPEHISSEQQ